MRSEREMVELILRFAERDERILAVIMNGSRVDPNAFRDCFQDYDIVYVVTDVSSFVKDRSWISYFGDIMIIQTPEEMEILPVSNDGAFPFLMQFTDGNRIDLTFFPVERVHELGGDSLSELLMDKKGIIPPFPPPSDQSYLPTPPSQKQFSDCCNEFWWVSKLVAKGLWRKEPTYAHFMLEQPVRDMLMLMLKWYVGANSDFQLGIGKCGKFLEQRLEPKMWQKLLDTYASADLEEIWRALFVMTDLFREIALEVAKHFSYTYPVEGDKRVTAHLHHVKALPAKAREMY